MLTKVDGKRTEASITAELADLFQVDESVIARDFYQLMMGLNQHHLLSIHYHSPYRLVTACCQFFKQYQVKMKERFDCTGHSFLHIFGTALLMVTRKIIFSGCFSWSWQGSLFIHS